MMSFSIKIVNGMDLAVDAILMNNSLQLNLNAPHPSLLPLIHQALAFIINF